VKFKDKLDNLPKTPGCYLMKNKFNDVIYVGKAKNLYNRLRSYFTGSHDSKTTKLVSVIEDFEYIITANETEAFVLELNLIKKYNPKYNISLTDDKRYPYILLTEEKHPRILYTRDLNKKGKYFGPYPNAKSARETVNLLNKLYPLRKCYFLPKKPCLYYHLGQCLAPCIKEVKEEVYLDLKQKIAKILNGNIKNEINILKEKMDFFSEKLEYEKALEYKNMINDLETLTVKQNMESNILNADIFGFYLSNGYISIQVFHVRNYKMVERNGFLFEVFDNYENTFLEFIEKFYFVNNNPIPQIVLMPEVDLKEYLSDIINKIIMPKRGKKRELVKLVSNNAKDRLELLLRKKEQEYNRTIKASADLAKLLNLEKASVIEAFDNSNILGTNAVSAMVYFKDGKPIKQNYRKYKVKTVKTANDIATMQEVIKRRFQMLKKENMNFPDLIIVDGAKAQVNASLKVLQELKIKIPVLGLVKNYKHKTDALYFDDKEIKISKRSDVFFLLEKIQEEVHRFAISYFRKTQRTNMLVSKLDEIVGLGPVKKKAILKLIGEEDFIEKINDLYLTDIQKEEVIRLYEE
jgi:excinuclease ABC subunit C